MGNQSSAVAKCDGRTKRETRREIEEVFSRNSLGLYMLSCANCNVLWADHEPQVTFVISPNPALMDDRVMIKVVGLYPNREVMIRARSRDQRDCWWHSSALFRARQDGSIDVAAQAPISGAYTGVDAMGLFWSMEPDRSPRRNRASPDSRR